MTAEKLESHLIDSRSGSISPLTKPLADDGLNSLRPVDRAVLLDSEALQTFEQAFEQLNEWLTHHGYLAVLLIHLEGIGTLQLEGRSLYDRLLDLVRREIAQLGGDQVGCEVLVALNEVDGKEVLVFLAPREKSEPPSPENLQVIGECIEAALRKRLLRSQFPSFSERLRIQVGFSLGIHNPLVHGRVCVRRAVEAAAHIANLNGLRQEAERRQRLQCLILKEEVHVVFQPIVDLVEGTVHGFEALSRGPEGSDLESPAQLFGLAASADLLFELDHVCRRKAVQTSSSLDSQYKLFINTLPFSVRDPRFRGRYLVDLFDGTNLVPEQIVLEVTEQMAIEDYAAYMTEMKYFSDMGCLTAIDDVGTGYSGLEKLVNIRPDYLKLDMQLVRDIDTSSVKKEIVKAFCVMAKKIEASVVAEGIETLNELRELRNIGVDFGQGYLLGKPTRGFLTRPEIDVNS